MSFSQESAEVVALKVLGWLAENEGMLILFMGASGAAASDLQTRAGDPIFLGSVLDFILMDDAWVIAACTACGLPFTALAQARAALPGGGEVSWT